MTDKQQPEALRRADDLESEFAQGRISNHTGRKAATELRRLHAESEMRRAALLDEMRKAARLHAENETLRAGYAAARLEIESLRGQQNKDTPMTNPTPHGQVPAIQRYKIGYHADEWGQRSSTPSGIPDASGSWVRYEDHVTALKAAQPVVTPQPGAAYAALPDGVATLCEYGGDVFTAAQMRAFANVTCALRAESLAAAYREELDKLSQRNYELRLASHGQAPAQATPAYKDSTPELHIGDSAFESWYSTYSPAHKSDKQRASDAYAAGMGEPLVTAAPAAVAGPSEAVAYLDIGTGGYLDIGTDLTDEALSRLPKGRHALVIAGTYGIDGYTAAPTTQPEPQPSPAAQMDALDAARLDWLTFNLSGKALRDIGVVWSEHGDARRAIDAARAAQEGNKL